MRTIKEIIDMYNAVFNGEKIVIQGNVIYSDRESWIVNNTTIDTMENKKRTFSKLLEKLNTAKNIAKIVGLNVDDEFYIIHDSIDNMILLVKNTDSSLNIVYFERAVIVEQIDKEKKKLNLLYSLEEKQNNILYQFDLSKQAIKKIDDISKANSFKFSQNDFYDLLPTGFDSFKQLLDFINVDNQTTKSTENIM